MRIPSGKTDQYVYFVAVDATDLKTREPGLSGFTVYRSRNGAAEVAYTTPTITEIDATNMPGVYALLVDEDTTIGSSSDSEQYCLHFVHASMASVTLVIELYRRDTTSGQTLTVTSGRANADITHIATAAVSTSTAQLGVNAVQAGGTAWGSGAITAASIASNAITSAKFAANALDAVWSTATRLLTAGTNIVLAKGTGITGFNDLSAAQVNAEADTALADVGVTGTVTGRIDAAISTRLATAGYMTPPTADEIADALLDRTDGVETGLTPRQAWRLVAAACAGKASGLDTGSPVYRNVGDTKDRITATTDQYGNRSAVTVDAT